ncbi:hypothetical protein COLO4_22757 [Corchorus olitorius]|uniref:Uncharacterized protein n=1 Tax=Corchorus olitorius TaxID=93759 RepID=A0A1R3IKB5_9ROSI|nr:hypothetical protein COLO4_22757 [Corchorus olitorius]
MERSRVSSVSSVRESSVDDDESWCYGSGKVPDSLGSQVVQIPPMLLKIRMEEECAGKGSS